MMILVLMNTVTEVFAQDFNFINNQIDSVSWRKMPDSCKTAYTNYLHVMRLLGNARGDGMVLNLDGDSVKLIDNLENSVLTLPMRTSDYNLLLEGVRNADTNKKYYLVKFTTSKDGALVKYITPYAKALRQRALEANGVTNNCAANMQSCQYYVWIERKGKRCSEEKLIQVDENIDKIGPIFIAENP